MTSDIEMSEVQQFARNIRGCDARLCIHQPEPNAVAGQCFANVQQKIAVASGGELFGWIFTRHFVTGTGVYYCAIHHSVWVSPDGRPIDVTPLHDKQERRPITHEGGVVFLDDEDANPVPCGSVHAPQPSKFFSANTGITMQNLLTSLRANEVRECRALYAQQALACDCSNIHFT